MATPNSRKVLGLASPTEVGRMDLKKLYFFMLIYAIRAHSL